MKAKKIIKFTAIGVGVLIIGLVIFLQLFGGSVVKVGVEKGAASALNVGVTLEKASLSILAGSVELKGLVIDNPEGYQHKHLLELGRAKVDIGITSLMTDTVKIDKILFEDMTVVIEQKGLTNNLKEILNSLPTAEQTDQPVKEEKAEPTEEKAGKNLLISDLKLTGITVKVKLIPIPGQADTITIKLAPIEMKNLGTEDKMDIAKLSGIILTAIAKGVAMQGAGVLPAELTDSISGAMEMSGEVLKEGTKALEKGIDAGKDILDVGKDLGQGLKGLFNGGKNDDK